MKHLIHWALGLLVLTSAVSLSGAWPTQQERKGQQPRVQKTGPGGAPQGRNQKANAAIQRKSQRLAAIEKLLPTLETTLAESIALAEKESGGKAYEANLDMVGNKAIFKVGLMVADHFSTATVDPATKAVNVTVDKTATPKAGKKKGGGDDKGEGDDEGGEGEEEDG